LHAAGAELHNAPMPATEPLTIAIPFYRNLPYLEQAVQSVTRQTSPQWRLLICDDSGPDWPGSRQVQRLVKAAGEGARYVSNRHTLGMVGNWNRIFELAETDRVTLLHQDDRLLPNYVQLMQRLAQQHPNVAAFYAAATIIDASGEPVFSMADFVKAWFAPRALGGLTALAGRPAVEQLIGGNFIMCPTLCYRRSLLGTRRFDPRFAQVQDLDFIMRLLFDGLMLLGSDEVAFEYRRHGSSATSIQSETMLRFEEEARLFDELATQCDARGWSRASRRARKKPIIKLHLAYRVLNDLRRGRLKAASKKLRFLATLFA